jgi:glutathione S-transferase
MLYQFEACPFCRKVREKLQALNLEYVAKSAARGSVRRDALAAHGRVQVPLLIDPNTGRALYESDAIRAYLESEYG